MYNPSPEEILLDIIDSHNSWFYSHCSLESYYDYSSDVADILQNIINNTGLPEAQIVAGVQNSCYGEVITQLCEHYELMRYLVDSTSIDPNNNDDGKERVMMATYSSHVSGAITDYASYGNEITDLRDNGWEWFKEEHGIDDDELNDMIAAVIDAAWYQLETYREHGVDEIYEQNGS